MSAKAIYRLSGIGSILTIDARRPQLMHPSAIQRVEIYPYWHGFSCHNAGLDCRDVVRSIALPGGSLTALQSVRWAGLFRFSFAADYRLPATA